METDNEILKAGLEKIFRAGPPQDIDNILAKLNRYLDEIELFNEAYGLVKAGSRRELIIRHILDSLTPLTTLAPLATFTPLTTLAPLATLAQLAMPGLLVAEKTRSKKIADVGSGAGLPGIPLAICMPGAEFTLIERMGRRAGFLRNCTAVLDLPNVKIEENEMEKTAASIFDIAVFRAFRPLEPEILAALLRLLTEGGFLAAYKGKAETAREELISAEKTARLKSFEWKLIPLEVPFLDEERHLAVLRQGVFIAPNGVTKAH